MDVEKSQRERAFISRGQPCSSAESKRRALECLWSSLFLPFSFGPGRYNGHCLHHLISAKAFVISATVGTRGGSDEEVAQSSG